MDHLIAKMLKGINDAEEAFTIELNRANANRAAAIALAAAECQQSNSQIMDIINGKSPLPSKDNPYSINNGSTNDGNSSSNG